MSTYQNLETSAPVVESSLTAAMLSSLVALVVLAHLEVGFVGSLSAFVLLSTAQAAIVSGLRHVPGFGGFDASEDMALDVLFGALLVAAVWAGLNATSIAVVSLSGIVAVVAALATSAVAMLVLFVADLSITMFAGKLRSQAQDEPALPPHLAAAIAVSAKYRGLLNQLLQ